MRMAKNRGVSIPNDGQEETCGKECECECTSQTVIIEENFAETQNGWGHCYRCDCQQFQGNAELCTNCGHKYEDHWMY